MGERQTHVQRLMHTDTDTDTDQRSQTEPDRHYRQAADRKTPGRQRQSERDKRGMFLGFPPDFPGGIGEMSQKLVFMWFLVCALSVYSSRFPQHKELASLDQRAPQNLSFPKKSIKLYKKLTMILRGGQDPSGSQVFLKPLRGGQDPSPSDLSQTPLPQQDQVSYVIFI